VCGTVRDQRIIKHLKGNIILMQWWIYYFEGVILLVFKFALNEAWNINARR
jgi:hypothetical protein